MAAAFGARAVEKWNKENVASLSLIVDDFFWLNSQGLEANQCQIHCRSLLSLRQSDNTNRNYTTAWKFWRSWLWLIFYFFFLYIYKYVSIFLLHCVGKITSTDRECRVTDLVSSLHWTRWLLCVWQKHRNVSNYQFLHFLCWTTGPFFFFFEMFIIIHTS